MVWHFHNTFKLMPRPLPYVVFHEAIQHEGNCVCVCIDYIRPMDVKLISAAGRMLVSRPYYNCISIPTIHSENHP